MQRLHERLSRRFHRFLGRMDVFDKFDVIFKEEKKEVVFNKRNGKET